MSSNSRSSSRIDSENSFDVEGLLEIGTRCRELWKEKGTLSESNSQSFELIRILESHVNSLTEARVKDDKHISKLERELTNCSQEIDYLQDQLTARNAEVNFLTEHTHRLEVKLGDMENLHEQVDSLMDNMLRSDSKRFMLMKELESKEVELQNSKSCMEKLEESISSLSLESQCEIESMKLDLMALEQAFFEAKKIEEEHYQEKTQMNDLIKELQNQLQVARDENECLDNENRDFRQQLSAFEINAEAFCQKIEKWIENKDKGQSNAETSSFTELENEESSSKGISWTEHLNAHLSKLMVVFSPDADVKNVESMSQQIQEYKLLVTQLKNELRDEKLKAKDEAENLIQEMAELRYNMTGLLEEECRRRSCIERASLQRIAELEAQIKKEEDTCVGAIKHCIQHRTSSI